MFLMIDSKHQQQLWPTQQEQFHFSGRLLSVLSEVFVNHLWPLRRSLILGAHRTTHGSETQGRSAKTRLQFGWWQRASLRREQHDGTTDSGVVVESQCPRSPVQVEAQRWSGCVRIICFLICLMFFFFFCLISGCYRWSISLSCIHPQAQMPVLAPHFVSSAWWSAAAALAAVLVRFPKLRSSVKIRCPDDALEVSSTSLGQLVAAVQLKQVSPPL